VRELDEAGDRLRVREQDLAGLGERDRAAALRPLDQAVADPPLQEGDLLADRRLSEAEPRGGAAERSLSSDCAQRGEMTKLDTGPVTEPSNGFRNPVRPLGGQPSFCLPPTWVLTMIVEPAISRG
jgi:hypothetical protein